MNIRLKIQLFSFCVALLFSCKATKKSQLPDNYSDVHTSYESYYHWSDCRQGETIASIGAGNGIREIQVSCFVDEITWYLQDIDSSRLNQFEEVLEHHENLKGSAIDADFNRVQGTENSTGLPHGIFDRVLMINVFHEIESRQGIMMEIHGLLKEDGLLVLMERMGKTAGEVHGDCGYPKLLEPQFMQEMKDYGYVLKNGQLAEEMSNLMFYTFESRE